MTTSLTPTSSTPYLTGHSPTVTKHHTLRTASNSAPHLLAHLSTLPQTTPITLLDIGCGSGTITASLASYLPPNSKITALDASPEILTKARDHAIEMGVEGMIEFVEGDVYNLPFERGTFDVVHVSMVLTHLGEPEKAVREMVRVVRKCERGRDESEMKSRSGNEIRGGVLSLREVDRKAWSFHPYSEAIASFIDVSCEVALRNGANSDAAQRLLGWTLGCEIDDGGIGSQEGGRVTRDMIKCSASAWCFATREEREGWGGSMRDRCVRGDMRELAIKEGLRSEEEFDEMARAWEEWIEQEDGWFGVLCGEVLVFF